MTLTRAHILDEARRLVHDIGFPLGLNCTVLEDPAALLGARAPRLADIEPGRWAGVPVDSLPATAAGIVVDDQDAESGHVAYRLAVLLQEDICLKTGRIWPADPAQLDTPL